MKSVVQYHELKWRKFANDRRLNLQKDENGYYVNPKTREAHAAWVCRSQVEGTSDGPRAYYNAAMQLASSTAFELLRSANKDVAIEVAKKIQALRVDAKDPEDGKVET